MNMQSEQINELVGALARAQGEIKPAVKSSINPHFKSKYADLSEVWEACREPLSKNCLVVMQTMGKEDNCVTLITTLAHSSGQWIKSIYPLACKDPTNPQSWGSAITYARRYTLSSIVGIAPDEDDDGNKASVEKAKPIPKLTVPEMTNQDQWKELNDILDECEEGFRNNVTDFLKESKISSFAEIDILMFQKIKSKCIKHLREIKK